MLLAESTKAAKSIIELLQSQKQKILIQKFVGESKGKDVRAFVVGDRVVAAMRRVAQLLGLQVAGVDMLEGKDGPQIMEVNSSPGLEGIERCTELDIAGAVIDYIAAQVDFPEIDVRQRLTVSTGYGVSEIYIPGGSDFVGMMITEIKLHENDINVLALCRDAKAIPNPKKETVLQANGTVLPGLC